MKFIRPFGPMIGETELTEEQNALLLEICEKNIKDDSKRANHALVGYIEKEFFIFDDIKNTLLPILYEKVLDYLNELTGPYSRFKPFRKFDIECKESWCNIQSVGEFNPLHNHCLSDIVCVIYPKIDIDTSFIKYETNDVTIPGSLHFISSSNDFRFGSHIYEVVPDTGKIYIFPGSLMHYTSPSFKEEDVRWSTSTNFIFTEMFYHTRGLRKS